MPQPRAILLVDDDPNIIRLLTVLLVREGHDIKTAKNGWEALEILSDWQPALIILDMSMPVMDGQAFLGRRQDDPELARIPVIVLSAGGNLEARNLTADAVLSKPFRMKQLLAQVERLTASGTRMTGIA
jgi:CheY-like chemotaxis protein